MPAISKIRFTNIIYEGGDKRYNDELFLFDGNNGAIVLENGGGKTVFIQTALQAIIPHVQVANRKMKNTLRLDDGPAHIAIEWILNERPRRYALTVVSLFLTKDNLDSYKFVYEYSPGDSNSIEQLPFVRGNRPADKGEMQDYYSQMASRHMNAHTFDTIDRYKTYIEENFHIISSEWESIVKINSGEGDVERFFDECKTTGQLIDRLLIPNIEDAMAGFESNKFADSFEARLDSFQQYKQFQDRLEEYRTIQQQVNELTAHFKRLDDRRLVFEANKSRAKAYFLLSEKQHGRFSNKLDEAISRLEHLEEAKRKLRHKELSLIIAKEQEFLHALEEELTLLNRTTLLAKEKSESAAKQLAQLKLAEQRHLSELASNRIERLQKELSNMDQNAEATDMMEQFEQIQQQLAAAFADRQEFLQNELKSLELQKRQYTNRLQDEEGKLEALHSTIEGTKLNEREESTRISYLQDEMDRIRKDLLISAADLSMENQLKQWTEKQVELDSKITETKNRNSFLKQEKKKTADELESNQRVIISNKTDITQLDAQFENLKKEEQLVISRLQTSSMLWANLTSIHDRQKSIDQSLLEEVERHTLQMERLLIDERIATRLFDDYHDQQQFFADSFLHEQIDRWRNQFSYLKTGIEFIMDSDQQITDGDSYPFWAMALITTAKEEPVLKVKLQGIRNELQFPVHVLTSDDAAKIIRGEQQLAYDWIIPAHWSTSTDNEQFEQWKEEIRHKAETASQTRQNYSKELDRWKWLQEAFLDFIRRYPVEHKQTLEQELNTLRQQEFELDRAQKETQRRLSFFEAEIETNQSHIGNWDNEMQGIARNIEKVQLYMVKEKQKKEHVESLLYYQEELSSLGLQRMKIVSFINELKGELNETEDAIRSTEALLAKEVLDHPLFAKVKNTRPVYSELSISVLAETYEEMDRKMAGLMSERNVIERELRDAGRQLDDAKNKIEALAYEYPGISVVEPFPSNGAEHIKALTLQLRELETDTKTAQERESDQEKAVNRQSGKVEARQSDVVDPISFQQPLTIEEKALKEAWSLWEESIKSAKREEKHANTEKARWFGIMQTLQIKAGEHQFLAPELEHVTLTDKEQTDFTYHGKEMVQDILQLLTKTGSLYIEETRRVEKERAVYTEFCRTTISDSRLQQTAVQGIESRRSYDDVLEYKRLLEQRLHMAEQYAEQHIHTHDKELELFLRHMSTHVSALRDELLLIPKKTSVKIEDSWRQIFHITVPEWQESEGKMLLRSHMSWILDQLEREMYQTENGLDEAKVRQSLEKWLNSRQLLQVVLQNKPIRISCHKVTNDSKISRAAYTWEESNNWSGGEKWSKNMSLFLGLLNYVAEKKQHIQPHMKRHRSVILDNPFGKASSGHVLTPVFFIAEQLGFQVITLTAHAEGKFLRDFFPIVYSCRLRQAVGTDRQVMTTKKTIQSAFLQDLEPTSLERLNETEQLDLFEFEEA